MRTLMILLTAAQVPEACRAMELVVDGQPTAKVVISDKANPLTTLTAEPRQIVVAQDGTGQFKSINEAMKSIQDATEADPVDIKIKAGIYVETITTRNWVNLIGADRDTCIIRYDGGSETNTPVSRKHTLWATSSTTLRNLTIVGTRVKYCIHSDGGRKFVLNIENCALRREYPVGEPKPYVAAFGIGLRGDQHIAMRDCLVAADLPIYLHNWNDQRAPCSMTLENCVLKGKEHAIAIYCLGSKQNDYFIMHDSVLEGLKSGVKYVNFKNIKKAPSWNGQSEIKLWGSGNSGAQITGAELKDDSRKRQSGIEMAAQSKAAEKQGQ
ncbi:MAG: pectinesterase family protein [Kiritimatiellia bacterium]